MADNKKHVAIITDSKGNIITFGHNFYTDYGTIHAEDAAIKRLKNMISRGKYKERRCRRLNMYIFRIGTDLMMSKPCSSCQELLTDYWSWFGHVYYSTGDEDNIMEEYKPTMDYN